MTPRRALPPRGVAGPTVGSSEPEPRRPRQAFGLRAAQPLASTVIGRLARCPTPSSHDPPSAPAAVDRDAGWTALAARCGGASSGVSSAHRSARSHESRADPRVGSALTRASAAASRAHPGWGSSAGCGEQSSPGLGVECGLRRAELTPAGGRVRAAASRAHPGWGSRTGRRDPGSPGLGVECGPGRSWLTRAGGRARTRASRAHPGWGSTPVLADLGSPRLPVTQQPS